MSILTRPIGRIPRLSDVAGHEAALILGIGVACRVVEFAWNRSFWLDESSLAGNILHKSLRGQFGPLASTQLAPPGFLVVQWLIAHTLGGVHYSLRLVPLASGIAALLLFRYVTSRCLDPRSALIALAMFVISDELIYYSCEMKQYSCDVALGLACYALVLGTRSNNLEAPEHAAIEAESRGTQGFWPFAVLGAFAVVAVWFSHPVLFVLAGVGVVPFCQALLARRWRESCGWLAVGLLCAASFAGVYAISLQQLDHRKDMWVFWASAFPPWPPRSWWEAAWIIRQFFYLFVNPLGFGSLLDPRLAAVVPTGLFFAGCVRIWRRDRALFWMFALPGAFTLLASCLRLYPFHGRVILFLVPALLVFIAEGAGAVRRGVFRWLVLAALFASPILDATYHLAVPRDRMDFHPYGDRRPVWLDPDTFPFKPAPRSGSAARGHPR